MSYLDIFLILVGFFWFYFYHFGRLHKHMSTAGVVLYTTLKAIVIFVIPFVALLFSSNVLALRESSVWAVVGVTFIITFLIITVLEDKKIGVFEELIKKAKDD